MKMNYRTPETRTKALLVDRNFLASLNSEASGENVSFETESDFDSFFNN